MKTFFRALLVGLVLASAIAAPALASSKDDCKKGGYARWRPAAGAEPFRNQGQCVSFVARGGTLVPLAELFACTSAIDTETNTVTASCTGAGSLWIESVFLKDDSLTVYPAAVNPDGTATISAPDVQCGKSTADVYAVSADGTQTYSASIC